MTAACPRNHECDFHQSVATSAMLRIKYATMFPYCNGGKHESCMRWWMMEEGRTAPGDLLPDGGRDWFAAEARRPQPDALPRVLVVDDLPLFRKVLVSFVRHAASDAVITEAGSAEEALSILRADTSGWTLVATDYNMGAKTGYELISEARAMPAYSQLPAVVFSSEADGSKRAQIDSLPRVRWLAKRPEWEPFVDAWNELVVERKT